MAHLMQSPGEPVPLHILPGDHVVDAAVGQPLRPYLAGRAVFACGGTASCGKCRVRVVEGAIAVSEEMREALSPQEIAEGWRLACSSVIAGPLTIMIAPRARSDVALAHCDREDGTAGRSYGVAVDVGTTTLAAALVDLASGEMVGRRGAMNPQSAWGADIMSRLQFALTDTRLTGVIRQAVGDLVAEVAGSSARRIETVVLVGNTVMHHLFAGYDLAPLSHVPFETPRLCDWTGSAASLQWKISPDATVRFVRPVGGFVGSDISAGLAACGMEDAERPSVFIDLGTNGEIVLGRRGHLVCGSTAAGPAFEAASISCGMLAMPGAISHVTLRDGRFEAEVVGGSVAAGICGSGLIDAVAAGLRCGSIEPNGRLAGTELTLAPGVALSQADLRELQLAKAAIAAGVRLLRRRITPDDIETVYLAGSFGNFVDIESACRIGLIEFPADKVRQCGNAALAGAVRELCSPGSVVEPRHIAIGSEPGFVDQFVDCLEFRVEGEGICA